VDAATFIALFPEFAAVNDQQPALVPVTLAQVELRVSDSWEATRDEIVGLECAASIAAGPLGRAAQMQAKDGSTTYSKRLESRYISHGCVHPNRVI
jgi:hypothetical protein